MNFRVLTFFLCGIIAISLSAQKKATKTELEASNIISFGNSVINLGNSYSQTIGNFRSLLNTTDGNIDIYSKNPNRMLYAVNCAVNTVQQDQLTTYTKTLKPGLIFPEKEGIIESVNEGKKDIEELTRWCEQMKQYFSGKEYEKDSDFEKYVIMRDSFNYYIDKASKSWSNASQLASDAGNRAELLLLEKSPLASFVISMKKDLYALESIFKMFSNPTMTPDAIKAAITTLEESISSNENPQNKDFSKLSDIYYKEVFHTFYRNCASSANTLKSLANRLDNEKDPEVLNSWFRTAGSDYSKAIEEYNKFINQ